MIEREDGVWVGEPGEEIEFKDCYFVENKPRWWQFVWRYRLWKWRRIFKNPAAITMTNLRGNE